MPKKKLDYHHFLGVLDEARREGFCLDGIDAIKSKHLKQPKLATHLYNHIVQFVNDYMDSAFSHFIKEEEIAKAMARESAIVYGVSDFSYRAGKALLLASLEVLDESLKQRLKTEITAAIRDRLEQAAKFIQNKDNPAIEYELQQAIKRFSSEENH